MGLCSSHYQQKVRGLQLTPLRQRPAEPLVTLGLRVPQLVREAASADPAGARAALVAWVAARAARHPIAPVSKGVLTPAEASARESGRKAAARQVVLVRGEAPAQPKENSGASLEAPLAKPRTRRWRCTRCNGVFRLPWRLPPEQACASRITRSGLPCGGGLVPASAPR